MASYRKTKSGWRVEICIQRQRDSGTFDTKAEAKAWADQREVEICSGAARLSTTKTLADAYDHYAKEVSVHKRGRRWEEIRLKKLARHAIAAKCLASLTKYDLIEWRDEQLRVLGAGSVIREMTLINHALHLACEEWGWIKTNPMKGVSRPRAPRARTRRPTQDEIDRIVLALGFVDGEPVMTSSQRTAVAYLFGIETAMRAGEICDLLPKHVDIEARTAHLPMTKNGLARDVPLSARAVELLQSVEPWGETVFQVSAGVRDTLFRRARNACEIEDLTFHDGRREATSRLAKKLHPLELARMTGHTNLKELLTYYNESASEIAKKL